MFEVKRADAFDNWLKGLKDSKGRAKIQARIYRLANGNPGDVGPIGEGLSELRIDAESTMRDLAGRCTCCYAAATRAAKTRTSGMRTQRGEN